MTHAVHGALHGALVLLIDDQSTLGWIKLSEQSWHERVTFWIVGFEPSFYLFLNFFIGFFFALSKRVFEEIFSPSLFGGLLFEDVRKQIFISLNQPLGIDLSVLNLFFSIPLDTT